MSRVRIVRMGLCGYGCPQPPPEFRFMAGAVIVSEGEAIGRVVSTRINARGEIEITTEVLRDLGVRALDAMSDTLF